MKLTSQNFHTRLDNWPEWNTATNCYFINHLGVDGNKDKFTHNEFEVPGATRRTEDGSLVLSAGPLPGGDYIADNGVMLQNYATALISNFYMHTGHLAVEWTISGRQDVVEAIWFVSPPHYRRGWEKDNIAPEYDALETNTPGHPGKFSSCYISDYENYSAASVKKFDYSKASGKRMRIDIEFCKAFIYQRTSGPIVKSNFLWRYRVIPMQMIIWIACPRGSGPLRKKAELTVHKVDVS